MSYYRKFIRNFAYIAAPLTELTGQKREGRSNKVLKIEANTEWDGQTWTEAHETAFQALKGALLSRPVLALPSKHKRWRLATDASKIAMGAVLSQYDETGEEHPIAFYSRKLLKNEIKWDIWELELAAVVWATSTCRHYLSATTFELITDSKVVKALLSSDKEIPSRRANCIIRLPEFHFFVTHRKGEENRNADFFSRWLFDSAQHYKNWCEEQELRKDLTPHISCLTSESKSDVEVQDLNLDATSLLKFLAAKQREDPALNKLINQLSKGTYAAKMEARGRVNNLKLDENGALMQKIKIRTSKVTPNEIPTALKRAVLQMFHSNESLLGHLGGFKTISAIKERFKWKGMKKDIKSWIRSCHHCLSRKGVPPRHRRYNLYEETLAPMNRVAIDLVGRFPKSKKGNEYILTLFCPFSHWAEAYPIPTGKAEEIIACLKKQLTQYQRKCFLTEARISCRELSMNS